jgi:predicted O-methyltransferase YrrM
MNNDLNLEVVLIFGAGSSGLQYFHANKDRYCILGFVDNNHSITELEGIPVYQPSKIPSLVFSKIIIASVFCTPIYDQLVNEINLPDGKIEFFHPHIKTMKDFKLVRPKSMEGLPANLSGTKDDVVALNSALVLIAERFMNDFNENNLKLVLLLRNLNVDEFYSVWQRVTEEIIFDGQYSQIFFKTLNSPILEQNAKHQNKAWLPVEDTSQEYTLWLKQKKSSHERDKIVWPLLETLITLDFLAPSRKSDTSMLFFFKDILYGHFICPEYQTLQKEIFSTCHKQKENWALPYCNSYPYQGLEKIGISGFKPSEERLKRYALDDILTEDKVVLDIGSNCGFLGVCIAEKVKHVDMVEFNPYLTSIAAKVIDAFGLKNVHSLLEDFTSHIPDKKYDVIFSLANHCTIDGNLHINFEEYIAKCFSCLNPDGYLIFESHNVFGAGNGAAGDDSDLNDKFDIVEKYFTVLRDKMMSKYVLVNDVDKLLVVLQRRSEYLPDAKRTFELTTSILKYHY